MNLNFRYVFIGEDTKRIYQVVLCNQHRYLVRDMSGGERLATFTAKKDMCGACFIVEHADEIPVGPKLLAEARQVSIYPDTETGAFSRMYEHAWNTAVPGVTL